jgi:zinc protease
VVENLHPDGQPYSWPAIGSHEDLTAASLEDVTDFFKTYYTPNNLSLVIAGDFDPAEAKRLVEKYFGGIPAGPPLDRPKSWIPVLAGERVVEAYDRVPQDRVYMTWPSPASFTPGDAELDLASLILADGLSSRLNKGLVYDRQLCTEVRRSRRRARSRAGSRSSRRRGPAFRSSRSRGGHREISRLGETGPDGRRARAREDEVRVHLRDGLEGIGGSAARPTGLNQYNTMLGDPGKLDWDMARYRNASVDGVRGAVAKWLDHRNRLLVRFRVEGSGRVSDVRAWTGEGARARAATAVPRSRGARRRSSPTAWTSSSRASELAEGRRHARDPSGRGGGPARQGRRRAHDGDAARHGDAVRERRSRSRTLLATSARSRSRARRCARAPASSFEVLKRNLDRAMAIFADVVRNASYPASEFDREKKRHLDTLSQQDKNANVIGARVRSVLAFGPDHPYGRPAQGFVSTVSGRHPRRPRGVPPRSLEAGLVRARDLGRRDARRGQALAEKHFGSWSGGAAPAVRPAPPRAAGGKIYVVDRQDAAQTFVSQFVPAPEAQDADYYALSLADTVVRRRRFGTRLNLNLREDKGYSYGVFSTLALFDDAASGTRAGGVQTNKTKESVVEFDKELKGMTARPLTEASSPTRSRARCAATPSSSRRSDRINEQIADLWASELP